MKKKDIDNRNPKGKFHGYQEWYWGNSVLTYRGNWKNGQEFGYSERHAYKQTRYYIK